MLRFTDIALLALMLLPMAALVVGLAVYGVN